MGNVKEIFDQPDLIIEPWPDNYFSVGGSALMDRHTDRQTDIVTLTVMRTEKYCHHVESSMTI